MSRSIRIFEYIAYFDIFSHPLKISELAKYSSNSEEEVELELMSLIDRGICFKSKNGFYSLQDNVEELERIRIEKEQRAKKYFQKLPFYAKLISHFPYVRGIAISGSLSKNVMHEDGDIDYFIITSKGRMWVCRTLLILFKKVFLLNSRKYFCLNYFVDEENLKIVDENIFTATEVAFLLPVYNAALFKEFKEVNSWTVNHYATEQKLVDFNPVFTNSIAKKLFESLLSLKWMDRLDLFFMRLTYKRWQGKFKDFPKDKLELTMRSNRGVSKHHPRDFQNKVLTEYHKRIERIKNKNESSLYA